MTTASLLNSFVLSDFPSGSGINFYQEQLYLIGDDATGILILDKTYAELERVQIFDHPEKRIPKAEKVDFETSTILTTNEGDYLCLIGSGSKKRRAVIFLMPLQRGLVRTFQNTDYISFRKRLEANGIEELNIEGATLIDDIFILANRSNHTYQQNYFIITNIHFWEDQHEVPLRIVKVSIPETTTQLLGISELCYVKSHDLLLVTLSLEDTSSSYDDGAIGDSYIGWIGSMSEKINNDEIVLDGVLNLSDVHAAFKQHKIEGICVESASESDFILHLVSDNDLGESTLFKLHMKID